MEEVLAQFTEIQDYMSKVELNKLPFNEQMIVMSALFDLSNAISEYNEKMMPIVIDHLHDEEAPRGSSFLFKM